MMVERSNLWGLVVTAWCIHSRNLRHEEINTDRVEDSKDGVEENWLPIGEMRVRNGWGRMKHAEKKRYRNDENTLYVTRTRASYTTLATFRAIPPRIFIPLNISYLLKRRDAAKIPRPCGAKFGRDGAAGSRFER
jgi:hypothetical protein